MLTVSGPGLQLPSDSFEVLQLLENYIPTTLATLTEPFWLMLNRLLCLLQPFKDLCVGKARPKRSIEATYTALPPQLAVWRALSAKHLVLAVVCTTALLANLLALSMGALFNEEPVDVLLAQKFNVLFAPSIDKSVFALIIAEGREEMSERRQPYGIAVQANITHGLPLPPWTTSNYYFHPVTLDQIAENDTITVRTRGYTVDTDCKFYPPAETSLEDVDESAFGAEFDDIAACQPPTVEVADAAITGDLGSDLNPERDSKYEYLATWPLELHLQSPGSKVQCDPSFILGWGRTKQSQKNSSAVTISRVACKPKFKTAIFNVTTDKGGGIRNYTQASKMEFKLPDDVSQDNVRMIIASVQANVVVGAREWSNNSLPSSGFNWLLSTMRDSDDLIDPEKDLPSKEKDVVPFVEELYRKYFVSFLSFNTGLFAEAKESDAMDGALHVKEVRIFMNKPAFIISQAVLGIYIMAVVLFYAQTSALVLPRMPTTIGSIIAYIAPSRLVTECGEQGEAMDDSTYSFGRYIGHDGKIHVGIERDPHVVRIDPESLGKKAPLLRRLGWSKRGQTKELQPWL